MDFQRSALVRFLFVAALSTSAFAQQVLLRAPEREIQGNTLHLEIVAAEPVAPGWQVVFDGREIPVFSQGESSVEVLVPVPVMIEPGRYPVVLRNEAGVELARAAVAIEDARFRIQNIRATSGMQALKPMAGEMEAIRAIQSLSTPDKFWKRPFRAPVARCMNSPFGVLRYHNGKPTGSFHRGIDQRSRNGAPVRATASGVVRIAKMFRLHGGTVGLDHGQGISSIYIHLSKLAVQEGDFVEAGDVIGNAGATGFATGPHLHWGLYVAGLPVNPRQWIPTIEPCR